MKIKSFTSAVLAFTVAATLLTAGPAHAGCVTKSGYSKVRNGMTVSQVASTLGTNGKRAAYSKIGSQSAEVRSYVTCSKYGAVAISFSNGRVSAKSGVF